MEEDSKINSICVSVLDASSRLANASFFVIDLREDKLMYKSDIPSLADAASPEDRRRESANLYLSLAPEEDYAELLEARKAYQRCLESFTDEQKLHHMYVTDYRICLKRRTYVVTQKFSPLFLDPDGSCRFGLFCVVPSLHAASGHFAIVGGDFRFAYDSSRRLFYPYTENLKLSLMEKAVIYRAMKGLTTHEIASDLSLSEAR
jgi:hypothetical protein